LVDHYGTDKVAYSLKTKSVRIATKRALAAAAQLDDYWLSLRMKDGQVPKQHLALSDPARISDLKPTPIDLGPTLTEAMEIYIRLKGHQRPKTFLASSERACRYLIEARGNKHLL